MKWMILTVALGLTGCATMERHPVVTRVVVGSLLLTGGIHVYQHQTEKNSMAGGGVAPPICRTNPEACR